MSKMLFDSQPLVIDPDLATRIGLNETIILQQLHYWIIINTKAGKNYVNGYYWTYNSLEGWSKQFPFWSTKTISRTITRLRDKNLLIVDNHNKQRRDRTHWYRINYEELEKLKTSQKDNMSICNETICPNGSGQSVHMHRDNLSPPLPETRKREERETPSSSNSKKPVDHQKYFKQIKKQLEDNNNEQ